MQDHFPRVEKMVAIGSGATRDISDLHLTRYACYLIIQNADLSKEIVALGQTYYYVPLIHLAQVSNQIYFSLSIFAKLVLQKHL